MKIKELEPSNKKAAILAADLHLLKKPGMWSSRAEIAGDDVYALQQIVELAKQHDADLYILGDTLDAVTTLPRPVVVAQNLLEPLCSAGHVVRYIQGQHEIVVQAHYENFPWLSLCRGTEHIHGCSFNFMGRRAFALDYFAQAFEALNLACVPEDTEVLFLHGTAEEVMGIGYHFSLSNVPPNVKTVYAGDYHHAIEYVEPGSGRNVAYTGSTWLRSADEPVGKSVILVEEGSETFSRLPLKGRMILRYSQLTEDQKHGRITIDETLPEALHKPVVIIDMPIMDDEYAQLAQYYHLHTIGSVMNASSFTGINVGGDDEVSDESILERFVDRQQSPSQFDFTLDVIQNNVGDALQRLRVKLGIETSDIAAGPVDSAPDPSILADEDDDAINLDGEDDEWSDEAPF